MRVVYELIGEHTATGPSSIVSTLGSDTKAGGVAKKIADLKRIITIEGIAGGSIVNIEGSVNGSTFFPWVTGVSADGVYIIDDGVLFMRSNCTTYGSGTIQVWMQKYVND